MNAIGTVGDIIRVHAGQRADKPCLTSGDVRLTWAEVDERSSRTANGLASVGIGNQDRVAFLDKNSIEYFDVFLGAAKLNAVTVAVNWRLAPPEVLYIVNDSQATVLVVGQDFVPVLDAIADQFTHVKIILVIGGHAQHPNFSTWRDSQPAVDPGVIGTGQDVAFQLYSSGTTGRPKGVMLTNDNFFALLPVTGDMWRFDAESKNLVAMPLFHIGGGGWAGAGMYNGCESVIVRELNPATLGELMATEKITHAFLVPAVLQFMQQVPSNHELDFSAMVTLAYGASAISVPVLKGAVQMFGCDFWQCYGLTETTGAIVNLPPADHDPDGPNTHRLRAAGLPGPGVEIKISNDDGTELLPDEVGEIWCRTQQNMLGYWNLPEETAKSLTHDGWFKTGDAGYRDADGYIYIHDRVKDMIVSGGENIYPAEIENVLMSHPAVADCAVIGIPSERWGESPLAMITRKPGVDATPQDIIAHCRSQLAGFKIPSGVEWIDVIPRNPSGKILKKDLRAPYWAGRERMVN